MFSLTHQFTTSFHFSRAPRGLGAMAKQKKLDSQNKKEQDTHSSGSPQRNGKHEGSEYSSRAEAQAKLFPALLPQGLRAV